MRVKVAIEPNKTRREGISESRQAVDFATHRAMLRKTHLVYLIFTARTSSMKPSLPYDDDPAWNASFARSQNKLKQMADKAKKDFAAGRVSELDPDNL